VKAEGAGEGVGGGGAAGRELLVLPNLGYACLNMTLRCACGTCALTRITAACGDRPRMCRGYRPERCYGFASQCARMFRACIHAAAQLRA
jgi:hypothetical protein